MKRAIRLIAILLSIGLIAVLGLFALAHIYKDDVIAKVMTVVNDKVNVPIKVAAVDFSLMHDFPNASILFEQVYIPDVLAPEDTLLFADELSLQFDVWDLVKEDYVLDKAQISGASLHMRTRDDGEVNYVFWETAADDSTDMTIAINALTLDDVLYTYADESVGLALQSKVSQARLKGVSESGWIDMEVMLAGSNSMLTHDNLYYLHNNKIEFLGEIRMDTEASQFEFTDCIATIGELQIPIQGSVNEIVDEGWDVDLKLQGDIDLQTLLAELPVDQKGSLDRYKLDGSVDMDLRIHGLSTDKQHPEVDLTFALDGASMQSPDASTALTNIETNGTYHRDVKGKDKVVFESLIARMPAGSCHFKGSIADFHRPWIQGKFSMQSDLPDLIALADVKGYDMLSGQIAIDVDVAGRIPESAEDKAAWNKLKVTGDIAATAAALRDRASGYTLSDCNAKARFEKGSLVAKNLSANLNNTEVEGELALHNLMAFLMSDADLELDMALSAETLDWDAWASIEPIEIQTHKSASAQGDHSPVALQLALDLKTFKQGNFTASNVSARIESESNRIRVNDIVMDACQGTARGSISASKNTADLWRISASADLEGIDIPEAFRQFDQFGQAFLLEKHLAGTGQAHIDLSTNLNQAGDMDMQSLVLGANLKILNGELKEHPAMLDIIGAMKDRHLLQPFVRVAELEQEVRHIRFSALENMIHITGGVITIPQMDIHSNTMDLSIAGTHSFENEIDYSLDFNLRDILVNRSNPEFYIEDDGLGHVIHLRMSGTTDKPDISLDKDKVRAGRKEAIAEAKTDLKKFFTQPLNPKQEDRDDRSAVKVEIEGISAPDDENKNANKKDKKKKSWQVDNRTPVEFEIEDDEDEEDF